MSDLHLGYQSGRRLTDRGLNRREMDGYKALHVMIDDVIADGESDAVLIAGDVFHTPYPSIMSIMVAQSEIRRLSDAGMPVYILTGNHDVSDIQSELAATALLNDPARSIFAHWEDYVLHRIGDGIYLHMVSHHLYKDQAITWDKVRPIPGAINIFTTHGAMIDPLTKMQLHTERSPREVIIPNEIVMNPAWDYRLLGHIHERGFVGSKEAAEDAGGLRTYYNGSLIRRGFADGITDLGRGWTKWTITPTGAFSFESRTIAQRPQIDFPVIDARTLTAAEVTDVILDNLDSVRADANVRAAPILRQRVTNITTDKKRAIDNNMISDHASFALEWRSVFKKDDSDDAEHETIGALTGKSLDEQYSNWLADASTYKDLHDSIRDEVADDTKRFIAMGQDSVLGD
jgi:DNA repair exonuclease SbcCD nuclease subunit